MSNQIKLSTRPRAGVGRAAATKLRNEGFVPAVIYGAKVETQGLEVNRRELERLLAQIGGESVLVDLEVQGEGKKVNHLALIQEVQHHPIRNEILHVDFHAVSRDEKIHTEVPIESQGEPEGVKTYGGLLENSLRTLAITCLPKDLPAAIIVDVSHLNIGNSIHVRDLPLPEGVSTLVDGDITVFSVSEPRVDTSSTSEEAAQPEVVNEKKAEGEADTK